MIAVGEWAGQGAAGGKGFYSASLIFWVFVFRLSFLFIVITIIVIDVIVIIISTIRFIIFSKEKK